MQLTQTLRLSFKLFFKMSQFVSNLTSKYIYCLEVSHQKVTCFVSCWEQLQGWWCYVQNFSFHHSNHQLKVYHSECLLLNTTIITLKKQKQKINILNQRHCSLLNISESLKKKKAIVGWVRVKIWLHQNIQHIHKENKKKCK